MTTTRNPSWTFAEMVLILLEDRFPWLGTDQPVSGSDVVDELGELYQLLKDTKTRAPTLRKLQP